MWRWARTRTARALTAAVAAAAALLLWLVPSGDRPYPQGTISFGTGVRTGVYERYGKLLKPDIERDLPGVSVRLTPSQGSVQNIKFVASGKNTFTIAAADAVADYKGPGAQRLRACARLYDDYVQLVVPNWSKVHSIRQLRGLRVAVGQDESGVNLLATRLLRAAGFDPGRDVRIRQIGIDTAPDQLKNGEIDAFFWSGGLPTTAVSELAAEFPIRLVPLGDLVPRLRALEGGPTGSRSYYRQAVMPADAYPGAYPRDLAVSTIAVANLLITTNRADAGLMERITRTVIDSRDEIGERVHAAQLVDLRTAIYTDPLPLHNGAARYYRSVKP